MIDSNKLEVEKRVIFGVNKTHVETKKGKKREGGEQWRERERG